MSLSLIAQNRFRRLATGLVAALALVAVAGTPADAVPIPPGSPIAVFIDTGTATANPADAIQAGWWGHEGGANDGTGTGTSFLDTDGSDPNLATTFPDFSKIRVAFVATSSDGSAEHPAVTAGESVGDAFTWFMDAGLQTGLNGTTNPNDSVNTVSTGAEFNAWDTAGQPVQGYDNNLVLHDVTSPGSPVSTAPKGKSILNRWATGTHVSMVFYATTGALDAHGQPIVAVGSDGHAITAYMPFITVQKPGDTLRTSAGYQVPGPYAPTLSLAPAYTSNGATLTVTVKNKANAVATDATGNVEFAQVIGGTDQPPTAVPTVNGVATLPISGFPPGSLRTYDVRYVPDTAGADSYLTTGYTRTTLINPIATSTSLSITGGATDTLTARVSPAAVGHVTFKNGTTTLGTATVSAGTAKLVKLLTAGKHVVSATFTPADPSTYKSSTTAKTVWQPTISTRLQPLRVVHGTRPKLTVKVVATGASVTGRVTLIFDPPTGPTKTITVTLRAGTATVLLPKTVKGTTKVTVKYLGNTQILAANKLVKFKAV